jgi:hypothetical protein
MRSLVGLLLILAVAWPASGHAGTPLATSISETATQYELQSITIDFRGQVVGATVLLLDASGKVIKTQNVTGTFADVAVTAAQRAAVEVAVVAWLKAKGLIN